VIGTAAMLLPPAVFLSQHNFSRWWTARPCDVGRKSRTLAQGSLQNIFIIAAGRSGA